MVVPVCGAAKSAFGSHLPRNPDTRTQRKDLSAGPIKMRATQRDRRNLRFVGGAADQAKTGKPLRPLRETRNKRKKIREVVRWRREKTPRVWQGRAFELTSAGATVARGGHRIRWCAAKAMPTRVR